MEKAASHPKIYHLSNINAKIKNHPRVDVDFDCEQGSTKDDNGLSFPHIMLLYSKGSKRSTSVFSSLASRNSLTNFLCPVNSQIEDAMTEGWGIFAGIADIAGNCPQNNGKRGL